MQSSKFQLKNRRQHDRQAYGMLVTHLCGELFMFCSIDIQTFLMSFGLVELVNIYKERSRHEFNSLDFC